MGSEWEIKRYKPHFVCFACRKTFKVHWLQRIKWKLQRGKLVPDTPGTPIKQPVDRPACCPQCKGHLYEMSHTFRAPRQSDIKAWREVEQDYFKRQRDRHITAGERLLQRIDESTRSSGNKRSRRK
jgi:hypothetical protein